VVAADGPRPTNDAFADNHNHRFPLYWTYLTSPHASGTNAMAQVWQRHQLLHINPPWGMIPRILSKLNDENARAVIVVHPFVAHNGFDEAGPTLHYLGKPLQRSKWTTGTGLEVALKSPLDGTKVGGSTGNRKPICIRAPGRTSHPTSRTRCIRRSLAAQ